MKGSETAFILPFIASFVGKGRRNRRESTKLTTKLTTKFKTKLGEFGFPDPLKLMLLRFIGIGIEYYSRASIPTPMKTKGSNSNRTAENMNIADCAIS